MYQSVEFQMFLRGHDNFEKAISQMRSPAFTDIAGVYTALFAEYQKTVPSDAETKIENYLGFFKGLLQKLAVVRRENKGTANCFSTFSRNYWTMCDSLQEFETNFIAQYFQTNYQKLFKSPQRESFVNPFEFLQNLLKVEDLEVSAMIDAINVKTSYESTLRRLNSKLASDEKDLAKLTAGKKTFSSFLSTKPKETFISNLSSTVEETKVDIQSLELILRVITIRLLEFEVPAFLKNRADKYEKSLRSFGRATVKEFEEIINVCKGLNS
jgi:hypothetical protein